MVWPRAMTTATRSHQALAAAEQARVPGRIPADARVVTAPPVFDYGSGPSRSEPDNAFTITDPAAVATIAAVIDGLRQPGRQIASDVSDPP